MIQLPGPAPRADIPIDGLGQALEPQRFLQVLAALVVALVLGLSFALLKQNWWICGLIAAALAALTVAYAYSKRGILVRAAFVMLATLTLLVSSLVFMSEGIYDEAVTAYPGLLIFASMFSSRRVFLSLLASVILVLSGAVVVALAGGTGNVVEPLTWGRLINVVSILSVTAFFVWLMASDLRRAMARLARDNERILESHARIEILAHRDSLTNLPNRTLAKDRLSQILMLAKRNDKQAAVLFLDLDNFKTINDSLGHSAGDQLLRQVSDRLVNAVRESDTVSRQGGDEFLILLSEVEGETSTTVAANKVLEQLSTPFKLNGLDVIATGSLGIAIFPKDGVDADVLLKNADLAMYKAKDSGRNAFRFFDSEMNNSVVEHLHLSSGMRLALVNGEFRVHYQPQFDLRTRRIVGAEALIRWQHADLGFIPPAKFIPVAERTGLINEIGEWVLKEVCRQTKAWQEMGLTGLVMAVNVSPVQFRRDDIEREVFNALTSHALDPSLLVADAEHLSEILDRLNGLGIKFAIDDFGTGYSNLGYLKRFAVQRLKIDQSFIRQKPHKPHNEGIVRAIIEMAHCLQLEVVAEGVEDAETFQRLVELGCEFGQGFLWSPALAPADFYRYVQAHQIT